MSRGLTDLLRVAPIDGAGGSGRKCPSCDHDYEHSIVATTSGVWRLLRRRPPAARCGFALPDPSGWSTGIDCGCRDSFHGS